MTMIPAIDGDARPAYAARAAVTHAGDRSLQGVPMRL
jgi:hypothetical protein